MKIIEIKPVEYHERIIKSLFPNVSALLLFILLVVGFLNLFNLNPIDKSFWIVLVIYIPLPIYLIIIKPYIEAKIYITKIELCNNQKGIKIDYSEFKLKKQITIRVENFKYNIFNAVKISLSDRIILFEGERKIMTQYCNSSWTNGEIMEVAKFFDKIGIDKPFGFNR